MNERIKESKDVLGGVLREIEIVQRNWNCAETRKECAESAEA